MYCTVDLNLGYQVPGSLVGRTGYRTFPFVRDKYQTSHYCHMLLIKETELSHTPAWVSKLLNKETDIRHASA